MKIRVIAIAFGLAAFWPLLTWYCCRLSDGSEDSLCLLALLTAVLLALMDHGKSAVENGSVDHSQSWILLSLLLGAYILLAHQAPNLVLAIVMVLTMWLLVGGLRARVTGTPAFLGFLLLSLPVVSSLNFFLGYPLRLAVTHMVTGFLSVYGVSANVSGTSLSIAGHDVNIDAPCSGVHYLWFSAYLSLLLAYAERASFTRTTMMLLVAAMAAFAGNVCRALVLSILVGLGHSSLADEPLIHQGTGTVCFFLTGGLILLGTRLFVKESPKKKSSVESTVPALVTRPQVIIRRNNIAAVLYAALCVIAAATPLFAAHSVDPALAIKPDLWRGQPSTIPLSAREQAFQAHFPGRITKHFRGGAEIIKRSVFSPTRQLHPAEDCLRGSGFKITADYLTKDEGGVLWHTVVAEKGARKLNVKERITDRSGSSWTRVSDWYWAAMLGQTKGPWLAVTKLTYSGKLSGDKSARL